MDAKLVAASAIALAVTLFAIFSLRPVARRLGLVDKPNERKQHRGQVPLIGGVCFFVGTVVGLVYLGYMDPFVSALMTAGTLIVLTGAVDDIYDLSVRSRLVIQAAAAFLVIAATGLYFEDAGAVLGTDGFPLGVLGIPVTVVAVMGLMNAFNMLDGIDGLAATLAMISIAAIMIFADAWPMLGVVLLLQVLFASLIPYLCVNMGWPDGRKIFMGDAGSTLIGFLLGWSLIFLSHPTIGQIAPVDALWCVALPIMDTLAVMQRRVRQGMSPFKADRQHIHHLLLDAGCTPRIALALIVSVAALLGTVGFVLREAPEFVSGLAYLGVLLLYMFGFKHVLGRLRGPLTWLSTRNPGARTTAAGMTGAVSAPPRLVRTLCVIGTPPDAVQIAPIAQQLSQDPRFDARVCVAMQHTDQAPSHVLQLFDVLPDVQLDMQEQDQDVASVTSSALGGIKRVMNEWTPDVVLVPGGASSSLATALAAFYEEIPVVCVEPGARVAGHATPRTDEMSRKFTRSLACLHFAPTEHAERSLVAEGVPAERIVMTGNTAIGSLRSAVETIRADAAVRQQLEERFACLRPDARMLMIANGGSIDYSSADVRRALRTVAMWHPEVDIVCPTMPQLEAADRALFAGCPNIRVLASTDYLAFAYLLERAYIIVAASSQMADKVAALGKPVLLMQPAPGTATSEAANVQTVTVDDQGFAVAALVLLSDERAYGSLCAECSHDDSDDDGACLRIAETLAHLHASGLSVRAAPAPMPRQASPMVEVARSGS